MYSDLWSKGGTSKVTAGQKHTVTNATVGFTEHITKPQLEKELDEVDMMSGFGNQFLWIFAKRTKVLPISESLSDNELALYALRCERQWSSRVARHWRSTSSATTPSRFGASLCDQYETAQHSMVLDHLAARERPQVRRLAVIFAVTDCSDQI